MRQIREVLRLKWECGLIDRKTGQSLNLSRPAVAEHVKRAETAELCWPLPATLDVAQNSAMLAREWVINPQRLSGFCNLRTLGKPQLISFLSYTDKLHVNPGEIAKDIGRVGLRSFDDLDYLMLLEAKTVCFAICLFWQVSNSGKTGRLS